MNGATTCKRCGAPALPAVRFVVAFRVEGEAAGPWCDSGDLCNPCGVAARRAIFGVLDVAPSGAPAGVAG